MHIDPAQQSHATNYKLVTNRVVESRASDGNLPELGVLEGEAEIVIEQDGPRG